MYFSASWNKLRIDLAREITVAICTAVLISLFVYMFNDFIQVKLAGFPDSLRSITGQVVSLLFYIVASSWLLKTLRADELNPSGIFLHAFRSGEDPGNLKLFRIFKAAILIGFTYFLTWAIIYRFLWSWNIETAVSIQSITLVLLFLFTFKINVHSWSKAIKNPELSRVLRTDSAFQWKLQQILRRNRVSRFCLAVALVFAFAPGVFVWMGSPELMVFISLLATGQFLCAAIAFQLQEDINAAWLERGLGIRHEDFVSSYLKIAAYLSFMALIVSALSIALAIFASQQANLKIILMVPVAVVAPLILPSIMFQVDPRKPFVQILIGLLVGLFLGTAVYASWLSIFVVPIIIYYLNQQQHGNFYRYL